MVALVGLTGCKTDDVDYLVDFGTTLNLKVTDIVYVLNEEKLNVDENTLIIPYFKFTWESTDENVAYIEDAMIKAVGVGNTTITFRNEKDKVIKTLNVKVGPTYEFSAVSGQTISISSAIPDYTPKSISDYNYHNFYIVDGEYIQAGPPSVNYLIGLTTINGIRSYSEFTILPYEGEPPFQLPKVTPNMNMAQVKEVMADYELTEEGEDYVGYGYGTFLKYSPFNNCIDIKFNFQFNQIYNFVINSNATEEEVLGYLFTNYDYATISDYAYVSNIFNGRYNYPHFQIDDQWQVFSNPNDYWNVWSSLVFATNYENVTGYY